jgi:hypothetical protein
MQRTGAVLLLIIVFEVSFGGGGRLIDTGAVSPRMVLFGLGLAFTAVMLLRGERLPRYVAWFVSFFVVLSCLSAVRSLSEGHAIGAAFLDFKPLAYFFLLPFFAIAMRTRGDLLRVGMVLMISSVALALSYLAIMAVWKSGLLTMDQMYQWLNPAHDPRREFYFRREVTFYFKAVLYLGVGVFFFAAQERRSSKALAALLLLAIAVTMTRGVWLAVFIVLAAWTFLSADDRLKGAVRGAGLLVIGIVGVIGITLVLPTAAISDSVRMADLKLVGETSLEWEALLAGYGFGAQVFGRQAIELTYINILYKQGIAGLVFWLVPLAYVAWRVRNIRERDARRLAMPFLMSTAFVYLVSVTNPFLATPIGLTVVMLAMVAVNVIGQPRASDVPSIR